MNNQKRKDYYAILGLTKTATTDEIKKAYKKLAIKWHPDKNPGQEKVAEEKFKEIAEAYSVLNNAEKRKKYDLYGTIDFDDVPSSGFGGFNGMGGSRKGGFGSNFGGFGGFTFERAEEIFREAFGEDLSPGFGGRSQKASKSNQSKNRRDVFDDDDDMFGGFGMGGMGPMGGMESMLKNFGFGGFGGFGGMGGMGAMRGMGGMGRDPFFQDDVFSGFDRMEQMMSNMGNMGGGGFGGASKSISTSTIIKNGKKVTVTKTTVTNPDGTTRTEVRENIQDDGRTLKDERYIDNGQNSRLDYNRSNSNNNNQKALGYGAGSYKGKPKY